jgi:hypothetical protein
MSTTRLAVFIALALAALFLLGANSGTRYSIEGFPMGKHTIGAVRIDQSTGEVCFFGARAEMYLPGGVVEDTEAEKLACAQ